MKLAERRKIEFSASLGQCLRIVSEHWEDLIADSAACRFPLNTRPKANSFKSREIFHIVPGFRYTFSSS
jgi:hypothetical protein